MGYITVYELELLGDPEEVNAFEWELLDKSKDSYGEVDPDVQELIDTGSTCAKLYDLQDWLDQVAPKHPNVLAILCGDGEEPWDLWEERYKGKFFERKEAVMPPFENEELLTDREKAERKETN